MMIYTRKEMINLLMLFEVDYAKDNENHANTHLNGKTVKQWIDDSFKLYSSMTDDELLIQHMTLLDGLYEEGNIEEMAILSRQRLENHKGNLWV